jgi:hypothetical protein
MSSPADVCAIADDLDDIVRGQPNRFINDQYP